MNELDKTIDDCLKKAKEYDKLAVSYRETQDNYVRILGTQYKPDYSESEECVVSASWNRQLAEWLRELKAYREDTRFADLYERICIKRDEDRDYFAKTKDQTYITRIAEKEMFIHMMQNMMFDRYGVEEENADADSD